MVTLANLQGGSLVPDIGFQLGRGLQLQGQLQNQQLQRQQVEAQLAEQQQLQQLLGQLGGGQPLGATQPQLGGQIPTTPGFAPPSVSGQAFPTAIPTGANRTQAIAQLAIRFPERFEQINKNLGLITQRQKDEASDFAFRLKRTPFANRQALIDQRVQQVRARGGNPADTESLRGLSEQQQDDALDTVQIAALSPEKRLELVQKGPEALQNIVVAAGGGFIGIDPTTRESVFVPPPVAGIKTQKQVEAERKQQEKRVTDDVKAEGDVFKRAEKLRSEIFKASTEFAKINTAFGRIEAIKPTAAGDLALIFNFMKMLDPGSTVREGEFATAQNSAGIPGRIRSLANNLLRGERLNIEQRKDFLAQSKNLFESSKEINEKAVDKIVDIGEQFGVSRDQLLGREQEAPLSPEEQAELDALRLELNR